MNIKGKKLCLKYGKHVLSAQFANKAWHLKIRICCFISVDQENICSNFSDHIVDMPKLCQTL